MRQFLSPHFEKWIGRTLRIPRSPLHSLENDDDWTFVIKMHAIVEAALNHLLTTRLNNPKVENVVSKLATRSKMAFIKAYDLLPEDSCLFVEVVSVLRNTAVHNATSFNLDLATYIGGLKENQRREWQKALASWWVPFPDPQHEAAAQHEAAGRRILDSALDNPRHNIFSSCTFILAKAQVQEMNMEVHQDLQNELTVFSQGEHKKRKSHNR